MATIQEAMPLAAGWRLDDYVIERVIERGRYGFSYLAQDAAQRECLIREFLPHEFAERVDGAVSPRDPDDRNPLRFWLRAFVEKSTQVSRLVHPALPRVLRRFELNGTAYEVSEYDPGETLQALLQTSGTLEEAQLLRILGGVMGAVEAAHAAGFQHRDLSLGHIWLRDSDGSPRLQEFGVLRAPLRMKSLAVTPNAMPPFASPESESVTTVVTPASDIYALGVIAYRALTGVLPPSARERSQGIPMPPLESAARVSLSAGVMQAIEAAMQLAPEQRPRTIADLREALRADPSISATAVARPAATALPPVIIGGVRSAPQATLTARKPVRFAIPIAAMLAVAAIGYLLVPKHGATPPPTAAPAEAPRPTADADSSTPSSTPAAPATTDAPASNAAATATPGVGDAGGNSLDRLAVELIARERKLQDARDALRVQEQRDKTAAELKARETPPPITARSPNVAPATTAIAPPVAPSPATAEAEAKTRALEQEVTRLRAESEARQHADDDAAKQRAQTVADKELAGQKAEADRVKQSDAIASARKNCSLPAMDLSERNNLNYYNALSVPGARKTNSGAIRLPQVEIGEGKIAVYEITSDSCAHRVR